jgi:ABC-2 type transport system ATP-binding protein
MIELKQVSKKFGEKLAVKDLSLKIGKGEIFCLIGPNGSGKTTTIKMITGLLFPDGGAVAVNNLDIVKEPLLAKKIVGYIPDEPFVWEKLTGEEFIYFVAGMYGISPAETSKKLSEFLKIFPIKEILAGHFEDYSRGTKQKVTIISALIHDPQVLVVDEPIVGLDPQSATAALDLFKAFAKKGGSVLLATHTLTAAQKIGDRFGLLKDGEMVVEGSWSQLISKSKLKNPSLEEIYLELVK